MFAEKTVIIKEICEDMAKINDIYNSIQEKLSSIKDDVRDEKFGEDVNVVCPGALQRLSELGHLLSLRGVLLFGVSDDVRRAVYNKPRKKGR